MFIVGQIRVLQQMLDPDPIHFSEVVSGSGPMEADPKLSSPYLS
jgi:hypothetical protein